MVMILRLRLYRLFLKAGVYSLPIPAFYLGWWLWKAICEYMGRTAFSPHQHVNHILFGALVWAFVSEHYRVTNFDELFRERTGARAATSACIAASFVLLALLYFSRNDLFPRGLLVCDIAAIFSLTVLLHAMFRNFFRSGANMAKPRMLLFVGADEFARKASERLQRLSFAPFQIAGFVRLPGQAVGVCDGTVYELEQLGSLGRNSGIDEAVIAVHPAQFSQIPKLIKELEHLCLPLRAVVDLGEGVVVRERLFQLGNVQMLDLTRTPTESLDYALAKRVFDICFSLVVLLLTALAFGIISLIIWLTSPGPIFFTRSALG